MKHQETEGEHRAAAAPKGGWIPWCIYYLKHKLEQRRTHNKKETSADRASRRTANATVAIAILTAVTGLVGFFQFRVLQGQLDEMKSSGEQTAALIETNKRLAAAATDSAKTAEITLKTTQRAYFAITAKIIGGFDVGGNPLAEIVAKNVGATPAYDVAFRTAIGVLPWPYDAPLPNIATIEATHAVVTKTK